MAYQDFIVRNPRICGGEPTLVGTRITLRTVLACLAEGATPAEIVADYPTLSIEAVNAVIAFAAQAAKDDLPVRGVPAVA
jgi:uncharacterized protein (DUF433 family)